ncbi:ABC transporter permease [Flaviaesturariibacter aridisoli]|uniref:ABC transporter permease n=1 Tax=Flaviaesturariibacter aridisoli TaxID=2545761 RepID=A0A4R4E1K5_9BACT|nr:FtsX-like permease family protein [Flaviaesturariibacter aridisoli]TCZ73306.1 ABC transporter permease [Flaviaesturariibacter aridisoli]
MNISTFIARRIAFNQERSFSRFIIRLSTVATVISVTVMIVTLSFVNGFQGVVSEKVFSFWGHIRIGYRQPGKTAIAEEAPMPQNDSVVRTVRAMKGVQSIHPFATKYAILKTPTDMEGTLLKGLDSSYDFGHLQPYLEKGGRWVRFNDSTYSRDIVVSRYTANQLGLKLADRVLIYFVRPDGSLRPDRLTIVGIYKTGIEEYDKTFAIGDIRLIRRLNGWQDNEVGGYEVFLDNYQKMDDVSARIFEQASFPELWETRTIREIYPNIFDWLGIVGSNGSILLLIVAVIVIINFITCLIILVLERIRMIGILKAVGATDWTIQKIFLIHSAFITVIGIGIGTGLSLLLIGLQQKFGFVKLKEAEYYMDTAAVQLDWGQVGLVLGCTLLLSVLVLLIPSLLVRKVRPIQAIRFS